MDIPSRDRAQTKICQVPVSTTTDEGKVEDMIDAELPASLADAIAIHGEREVFKRFINSYVVYLQGLQRTKMRGTSGKERVRAKYLEELNL